MSVTVATAVARQRDGMQRVGAQRLNDSYQQLQTHPGTLAAQHKDQYLAGVTQSVNKWVTNVQKMPLAEMKSRMATKGVANYNSSIDSANKMYAQNAAPYIQAAQQIAAGLPPRQPKGNNDARMLQQSHQMRQFALSQIGQ